MSTAQQGDVFEDGPDFKVGPLNPVVEPELSAEEQAAISVSTKAPEEAFGEFNKIKLGAAQQYTVAGRPDPPKERLARLQLEVQALLSEVEAAKGSMGDGANDAKESAAIATQVKTLAESLQTVELDALSNTWNGGAPAALQTKMSTDLLTDIQAAKTAAASKKAAPAADGKGGDTVTYEVYLNPEQTKLADATRASQLDERLKKLENLVGTESLSRAAAVLKDDEADITLATSINKMSTKLDALTEDGVDTIRARLEAVLKLADEVGEKKGATDKTLADEQSQRIEKLYTIAAGLDKFATSIPLLIERLTALKAVHEKGADFAKTVAHLDTTQKQLEAMFTNDKKTLEKLTATFAENAAKIEANFKATEERVKRLEASLGK